MATASRRPARFLDTSLVALALAACALVVHLATATRYGWFRDEFYYVACGDHLAFGYVDQPPFVALVARVVRSLPGLGGDSPFGLRAVAALVGAGTIALTGRIARQLGAGTFGVALASSGSLVAPLVLSIDGFFSMNVFDLFFWALASSLAVSLLFEPPTLARWVAFGVVVGVGLENKLSIGFFAAGFALGVVASPSRDVLRTRGPWLSAALAIALWLPNIVWNARSGWMNLEFMNHARLYKNALPAPGAFALAQVLQMQPVTAPVWLLGLGALLFWPRFARVRPLGVAYVFTLVVFMTSRGKPYYVGPAYASLFAAGGVCIETWVQARWARGAALATIAAAGLVTLPLAVPLLSPESLVGYQAMLGAAPHGDERGDHAELPQRFADEFGWETLVEAVARARDQLPEGERADVGIFARNYGEAGAIDLLGGRFGLPHAMSAHNNYWVWGPRGRPRGPFLIVGGEPESHRKYCGVVEPLARRTCRFCMPEEQDLTIYACREPKSPIADAWPKLKHFE